MRAAIEKEIALIMHETSLLMHKYIIVRPCMGNLLSLEAKMCIWNLTEGRSRNCDFKCNLGTYFCGVWIVFM